MHENFNPLVLLVDSDDVFRGRARKSLEKEGFSNILEASNGLEALSHFKSAAPYLVIIAADMPVKDGFSTCKLMRSLPHGEVASILMLINGEDYPAIDLAYQSGATDFICKPVPLKMLAKRVQYLLRNRVQVEALHKHEQRVRKAYRIAHLGHWEWQVAENKFSVSMEIARMFQVSRRALRSVDDMIKRIVRDDRNSFSKTNFRVLNDHIPRGVEYRITLDGGSERVLTQWVEVEKDEHGELTHLTGIIQDITERKESETKIYNLSHYDALTGLPNRDYLKQHLGFLLEQAKLTNSKVAIIAIDIDQFSRINDALGHSAGDQLLSSIADRLNTATSDNSLLTADPTPGDSGQAPDEKMLLLRTDADEFTIVVSYLASADKAGVIAERISYLLARPFTLDERELSVTASMGISIYPLDSDVDSELLECANSAVKYAKDQGRNNYQYYMQSLNQRALKRLGLEHDLHRAFERDEFLVYYQPKVNLKTGYVDAVEALVRWHHPELGIVSPAEFVELAEDIGMIVQIGDWVLRESCRQTKLWLDRGQSYQVAVNLSPKQLADHEHLMAVIANTLEETGLPATLLELELTESVFLKDTDTNRRTISNLKEMGVAVAIDDFGTGYSSLSYLTRFPVDTLKIDRSFISGVSADQQHAEIVKTIIDLARKLNMKVVAEGVSSSEALEFLKETGCDYGQGYLFSPPMPAELYDQWVDKFHAQVSENDDLTADNGEE